MRLVYVFTTDEACAVLTGSCSKAAWFQTLDGKGLALARRTRASRAQYDVGYGKPPVATRFQKGRSGNPNGRRPKPPPVELPEGLDDRTIAVLSVMGETISYDVGGRIARISSLEALVRAVRDQALGQDMRAMRLLLQLEADAKDCAAKVTRSQLGPELSEVVRKATAALRSAKLRGRPDERAEKELADAADRAMWSRKVEQAGPDMVLPEWSPPQAGPWIEDERLGRRSIVEEGPADCRKELRDATGGGAAALSGLEAGSLEVAQAHPAQVASQPEPQPLTAEPVRVSKPARQIRRPNDPVIADLRPLEAHGWTARKW